MLKRFGAHGLKGVGGIVPLWNRVPDSSPFDFDLDLSTFTPNMDKRLTSVFYTSPIVQGDLDGTGVPDVVTFPRGGLLANQTESFYANHDPYQGSVALWFTPEWDGNDGLNHYIIHTGSVRLYKTSGNNLSFGFYDGGAWRSVSVSAAAWTAGTTYFIVGRWDVKNTLDGTNYACVSVNNVHAFDATTSAGGIGTPSSNIPIGSLSSALSCDAIIEGLTISRRVLTDGDGYGTNIGVDDEIEDIYAAGAGVDPTLITTAFDTCLCVPTNSTDEALTTGNGEAWSMPHADSIPDVTFMSDGGLPGTPFAIGYNATTTNTNCGSGATLDDLHDFAMTVEGQFLADGWGENSNGVLVQKGLNSSVGWSMRLQDWGGIVVRIECATQAGRSYSLAANMPRDGKYHHIAFTWDDATYNGPRIWIDGVEYTTNDLVRNGAVLSDAAEDLIIGNDAASNRTLDGKTAWVRISDNIRYTADFIAPRAPPAVDGNTVEQWEMDEGTGATAAAQVTSPANDGTITAGTWSSIWQIEGTPVVPQSHTFDGSATFANAGSAVALDDIPAGGNIITVEGWVRYTDIVNRSIGSKGAGGAGGWALLFTGGNLRFQVDLATTDVLAVVTPQPDDIYHHCVGYYNDTTKVGRVAMGGLWGGASTGVGAYQTDAANNLIVGALYTGTSFFLEGGMSFFRVSDNDRYGGAAGTDFVPPSRSNPPAADGNTVVQYNFVDGAGTTLTDVVGPGTNNGTITPGTGQWLNTPDMALDEPGARTGSGGLNIGSDGAQDGITIIEGVTAEQDFVHRLTVSYGQSGRAWPEIYLWDNIGGAQIGATYFLPRVYGQHTGGAAAPLTCATGYFTQQLVGWTLYNITQGTSGVVATVTGDKTTVTGGPNFNLNDFYLFRPPDGNPYCKHPVATESIFVFRSPVACTSLDIKIRNGAGEGVMQIHQCEVYESLLDNGDHESLTGANPDIITGWVNGGLDAGDTESSAGGAAVIHAGSEAMEWNPGAINNEGMYFSLAAVAAGTFVAAGMWSYGSGGVGVRIQSGATTQALLQYSNADFLVAGETAAYWTHTAGVWRDIGLFNLMMIAYSGAGADRFTDDIYAFELDDVSLTVTPANQANSLEGTGIRVDGRDTLTQPIPVGYLTPTRGWIRWNYTPRHDAADMVDFGVAGPNPVIAEFAFDANRRILMWWNAASVVTLWFNDGGGAHTVNWNAAGAIVAGTEYLMEVRYTSGWLRLYVDGVQVAEIVTPILFTAIINTAYWATNMGGTQQADAVISPP